MRVVVNLIPVRSGGGQRQALNLLSFLSRQNDDLRDRWLIFTGQGSVIHQWLLEHSGMQFRSFRADYLHTFFLDYYLLRRSVQEFDADIIFHFTAAWKRLHIPQVVRSVYSNLYFPEIQFWPNRPILTYLKKKLIDRLRLVGTLRADGLIFENRAMQSRSLELFKYPRERTCYIAPARANYEEESNDVVKGAPSTDSFRILYLSSWYLNKNIQILPDVAAILCRRGLAVRFVLSLEPNNAEVHKHIVARSEALGVLDYFELVGTVHPDAVASQVRSSDCMILLSQLECFSSNVVEAWTFGKPLIITDLEWAHAQCEDAALYVDRDSATAIANAIGGLCGNFDLYAELVRSGFRRLGQFNSIESKSLKQIAFLEHIYHVGKKS